MRSSDSHDREQASLHQLSHLQSLIWAGQQLDERSPLYNTAFAIRLRQSIDAELFERAFRNVVSQSREMRTSIAVERGLPTARTHADYVVDFQFFDLSDRADPEKAASAWCDQRCRQPFSLDRPMVDAALLQLGQSDFVWYICQHHIICDAWSVTQLLRLVDETYQALRGGDRSPPEVTESRPESGSQTTLPDPQIASVEFGGRSPGKLTNSSTRSGVVDSSDVMGARLVEILQRPDVRSFSKGMSQLNVVLTLLVSFLARASGQREFCLGVPFHGRRTLDQRQSLGAFIEFYPLQLRLAEGETFASLHEQVRTATAEHLKMAVAGEHRLATHAGFNVICNFIHAEFGEFDGVPVEAAWLHPGASDHQHHLRLHAMAFSGAELALSADFNDDCFTEQQRHSAIEQFRRLVEAMAADWGQAIDAVDVISSDERDRQLAHFNDTPPAKTQPLVLERILQVAERQPDTIALREGDCSWTYAQLVAAVAQTASTLRSSGCKVGDRVGIATGRSAEAVIGMLAAHQAGVAFIPIDPAWPEKRMAQVMKGVHAACVSPSQPLDAASVPAETTIIEVLAEAASPSGMRSPQTMDPNSIAYVLFTSGSTGTPKGVEIRQASIANYVNWACEYYGSQHGDREPALSMPLFTPLTFDLTLTSIFVPLATGGTVHVYPESGQNSDIALLRVIEEDQVDVIKLTPSHVSLLEGRELNRSRVRQLILGGENLSRSLASQLFNMFPPETVIHNEYGPTEATIGCIVHSCRADQLGTDHSVPIGTPIQGMSAYVLNEASQLVPTGVPGELHVSGSGLAAGYAGDPETTSDRFVSNPHRHGERMYRTGDLVRFNDHGTLEYLGRRDAQVKIRGVRIEVGEVEAALLEHPRVSHAVVRAYSRGNEVQDAFFCVRCGLASTFPDATFNADGVCNQCQEFEQYRDRAQAYFKSMAELESRFTQRLTSGHDDREYDCLALLSGGKDSTYMLSRLSDMGLNLLAFTLDNGYISPEAKANIRRVVTALGVDHQFGSTEAMNAIFVDSLNRFANVCQGCFKTIYTLALNLAKAKKIPFIATGLSRGQFFETRLTPELFQDPCDQLVDIDTTVLDARKAYHRLDDAVKQHLEVRDLQSDDIFEQVEFVDFYRYCDVELQEMYAYLDERLPWVRPSDTGRSTNCLINDVGIYVHKRRMGYHNYALPYSWDVRLGHKQRDAALDELDDDINVAQVHRILDEIGFEGDLTAAQGGQRLVAYFVGPDSINESEITAHLAELLPQHMMPSRFIRLDELPLTANGKLDEAALPHPSTTHRESAQHYSPPVGQVEQQLADIWAEVLGVTRVGALDDFFRLGGDSILAIQVVSKAHRVGIEITPGQLFEALTVRELARAWETSEGQSSRDEAVEPQLSPIQHWALEHQPGPKDYWNQSIQLQLPPAPNGPDRRDRIQKALLEIVNSHDALRTVIGHAGSIQQLPACDELPFLISDGASDEAAEQQLHQRLAWGSRSLLGAIWDETTGRLLLAANHMAVDAISWEHIASRLQATLTADSDATPPHKARARSFARWSHTLMKQSQEMAKHQGGYWERIMAAAPPLSVTDASRNRVGQTETITSAFDAATTNRLVEGTPEARVSTHELIVAALAVALGEIAEERPFRLFIERHGRETIDGQDFSQTVGWFTSLAPVRFEIDRDGKLAQHINMVKTQLRDTPAQGIGYGVMRYLSDRDPERIRLAADFGAEVVFNFLGRRTSSQCGGLEVTRPLRLHRKDGMARFAALDITAVIQPTTRTEGNTLHVDWEFCPAALPKEKVIALKVSFEAAMHDAIDYVTGEGASDASAADFPLAQMSEDDLGRLASLLGSKDSDGSGKS